MSLLNRTLFSRGGLAPIVSAVGIIICLALHPAAAVSTADSVLQYAGGAELPGSYWGQPYDHASAALGLPNASINLTENDAQGIYGDHTYISPFNADYDPANVVALAGSGGYLELHFSHPVATTGYTLGVHTGSGLEDFTGSGTNGNPAQTYTDTRSATVLVSEDGTNWISLGAVNFNNPTNIYTNISGPYSNTPGTKLADFGKPFLGNLNSFDGKGFADTINTLDGSAGGTWLDLSATGLSHVNDIAFQTAPGQTMFVDAVVGIPAPEPTTTSLCLCSLFLIPRPTRREKLS